jgi:RNA polymerase-binding transcription factor DksA
MALDTIEWKRRSQVQDRADDTPDKIEIAKRRSEAKRNARRRVERIATGLPTRPRKGRPVGTWNSTERPDTVSTAGYRLCSVCGRTIADTRLRSSTCSPTCRRAAYRHSNLVNHEEGEN